MAQLFFYCPKCRKQNHYKYEGKAGGGYGVKCYYCGHDERSNPAYHTSTRQRQKKDEDTIKAMVASVIGGLKTPTVHFGTATFKQDVGQTAPSSCWACAVSATNSIMFPPKLWDCPRTMIADTVAHECGHIAPERGETLDEWGAEEAKRAVRNDQGGYDFITTTKGEILRVNNPEMYARMKEGWPDNKIPSMYVKKDWGGGESAWDWDAPPEGGKQAVWWQAQTGHGHGWFLKYHDYKGSIKAKFSSWINDPNQPPARNYDPATYTREWFKSRGYRSKEDIIKTSPSHIFIDPFGDKFYGADDDWNDYVRNLPNADNNPFD